MNRVGATIGSAALLMALSVPGQSHAAPTPEPAPPAPVTPSPAAGPLPGPAPAPAPADPAAPPADPADGITPMAGSGDVVKDACDLFFQAGNLAATSYEEFADASEGSGNDLNWGDPEVERTSLSSRVALRQGASAATEAANMPGLPPEVADPMRSWSFHVNKLFLVVSVRAGRDSINNAVQQVNDDYGTAQQLCATTMFRNR